MTTLVSVSKDGAFDLQAARYKAAFDKIHIGKAQAAKGRAQWIDGTLELAAEMRQGRGDYSSHQEFSLWLERHHLQKISKDDRTALLWMAEDPEATRKELEQTDSWSWLEIYRKSPQRRVRRTSKTQPQPVSRRTQKKNRIPDVMRDDLPPKPERKAVILKGLTREQVDPDFKGTSLQFRTKYGHVHLQTKEEIEHHKRQETLQTWLSTVSDHDRTAKAMLTAFAGVDPAALQEWMSKLSRAEKFRSWYDSIQAACGSLHKLI